MGFAEANAHLASRGVPASKFENVGDSHTGILKDVDLQPRTDTDGNVQYQKDGTTPQMQLVLTWETDERNPDVAGDTGRRKVYCSWRLEAALKSAYKAAGAEGLEPDAEITITYTGDIKVNVPGSNMKVSAKEWDAQYKRPVFKAGSTPKSDATADAETAGFPSEAMTTLAQQMYDGGIDDFGVISQATGIDKAKLQDIIKV